MKLLLFPVLALILFSCSDGQFTMKDVSELKITQNALADNSRIQIIYSSGAPDENEKREYYIQYIVLDSATQDTFRVLTPDRFGDEQSDPYYRYISIDSKDEMNILTINALTGAFGTKTRKKQTFEKGHPISKKIVKEKISKVVCNNEYRDFESQPFPTVTGFLIRYEFTSGTN